MVIQRIRSHAKVRPASIWQLPEIQKLAQHKAVFSRVFHHNAVGASSPKPTRIFTSLPSLSTLGFGGWPSLSAEGFYQGPLPKKCSCGKQRSQLIAKGADGSFNTTAAAVDGLAIKLGKNPRRKTSDRVTEINFRRLKALAELVEDEDHAYLATMASRGVPLQVRGEIGKVTSAYDSKMKNEEDSRPLAWEEEMCNTRGTFGVTTASFWWGRVASTTFRVLHRLWPEGALCYLLLFADDGLLMAGGEDYHKLIFLDLLEFLCLGRRLVVASKQNGLATRWI